ncbi:hypothetical protein DAEQUDRAFT_737479 [Daedalea quercina L-15889]|uniref:Uncharacterized protein n=1 Tax=Daedalea quercina L-15889 TaxID=1314783 RepID=A0A165R3D0_9APHY|nr:hypothetical protein DAEQUDRAFT_737479 [Daedalea quercina L-15889]
MLDFTQLTSLDGIANRFTEIASALLHHYRLSVDVEGGEAEYELMEIEFYLYHPSCHEDPFTHRSHEQQQAGQWYFHRAPRRSGSEQPVQAHGSGYRGGTRKGLDVTIGIIQNALPKRDNERDTACDSPSSGSAETAHPRGGILLRTMRRISDNKIFSGPSLLVDELLRASRVNSIAELVTDKLHGDTSAFSVVFGGTASNASPAPTPASVQLRLKRSRTNSSRAKLRIFQSPRIGLDLSNPEIPKENPYQHPRVQFVARPYRYFVHPHLLTANGRGQTFLGVHHQCADQAHLENDEEVLEEIMRLTGLKAQTAKNYLAEYRFGLEKGQLKAFLGAAGKGASAAPITFLRMMGTLVKLAGSQSVVA